MEKQVQKKLITTRTVTLAALLAAATLAATTCHAALVGSNLTNVGFFNGFLKNGNLGQMKVSDNMRATIGTTKLAKNNFRSDWYTRNHTALRGNEDIESIGIELEAQTTLSGTTDVFLWNNDYGEWTPAGKMQFLTSDKVRHITFTDDWMWDYVDQSGDVYVAFARGATLTFDLKVDRVHVDIVTRDFTWRLLSRSSFGGGEEPRTAIYRTPAQLAADQQGKTLSIDWNRNMAAFISIGWRPATNFMVNILGVQNTGREIVVSYNTLVSGFGAYVLTQPCAYLEMSQSNLPVRFVDYGVSYAP